jgi:hypothetical protein
LTPPFALQDSQLLDTVNYAYDLARQRLLEPQVAHMQQMGMQMEGEQMQQMGVQ